MHLRGRGLNPPCILHLSKGARVEGLLPSLNLVGDVMAWNKNSSSAVCKSLIEKPLETEREPACQWMCGASTSPGMSEMPGCFVTRRTSRMIYLSSVSREAGFLFTPSTVSNWDAWGISTKEESALKSREKRRGYSSDLTRDAPSRVALCLPFRKIM